MGSRSRQILVAEGRRFSATAESILRELGQVHMADLDRRGLLDEVRNADVLWVRLRNRIDAEVFEQAPRLKFVVSATTGLNHIDVREAEKRGIGVISLRGEKAFLKEIRATAELTIALILALLRHLPAAHQHVREGGWDRDLFWGSEIHRKTVGIVGYGRLGRLVGNYLLAFGSRVLASDPLIDDPSATPAGITMINLPDLLAEVDLVTIHVDLNDQTRNFFGAPQFAVMRPGGWFINTARGELIDERALLSELETGRLAGAAVDVLTGELQSGVEDYPLIRYARTHDNLLITPHIGGCTSESVEKTEAFLASRLKDLIAADCVRIK